MNMQSNIDDIRAEIMRLEAAAHFDADAWSRVLADLSAAGRASALADAQRRMETARSNQPVVGLDIAMGQDKTVISLRKNGKTDLVINAMIAEAVAVETGYNADGSLKAYWVQRVDDDWGMWIHAETVGKAKSIYRQQDPSLEPADFTDIRATRPTRGSDLLDCTPFTDDTLRLAGYRYENEDYADPFLDFCPCSMCRFEKTKPEYRVGIKSEVEV